jgi:hypothetical protein
MTTSIATGTMLISSTHDTVRDNSFTDPPTCAGS